MRAIVLYVFFLTIVTHNAIGQINEQISLSSYEWKFIGLDPKEGAISKPDLKKDGWLPIKVPGDVNASLLEHGKIPDPHYDIMGKQSYWITSKEWWYALQFDINDKLPKNPVLVFESIDGTADIWLNGTKLGVAKNSFYPHKYNVNGILNAGTNILYLRFPSINILLGSDRPDAHMGWISRRGFLRKPMYNFGIDWVIPIPSIGLAGDVYLENGPNYTLINHSIRTYKSGRIDFTFEISDSALKAGYEIKLHVSGHNSDIEKTITRRAHRSYVSIQIPDPQLWYPNGYGKANLYDYKIDLVVKNQTMDSKSGRFGIREVKILENPFTSEAGPGFSYQIVVNDEPVFCKGSNWIPLEIWPAMIKTEKYDFYLSKAKEANFNMLRVWGGGIYENDRFYNLCDELGIMIWQDFMFIRATPVTLLRDEIIREAEYQIKRLRNHPSIVLWCGGNETQGYNWRGVNDINDPQIDDIDSGGQKTDPFYVNRNIDDPIIMSMILRGTATRLGLGVPYVESSPFSNYEDNIGSANSGNAHISCWKTALFNCGEHPENWMKHFNEVCSFDSEFCIQGPCNVKALKKFMAPGNLWPPNDAWIYHIQRGHKNIPHYEQTLFIAGGTFGKINTLQEYVKHGQATHIEQTRAEYESARRDRPNNGGTLSWMYNDCWPTSIWSIIDYYQQEKPSFYAAKRACTPILPIIFERSGFIEFFMGNDTLKDQTVKVEYGQQKLDGTKVWSRSLSFEAAQNSTFKFDRLERSKLNIPAGDYLYLDAQVNGRKLPRVIYFPDGWKDIQWPKDPSVKIEIIRQTKEGEKWTSSVKVSSDKFVRLCHIQLKEKFLNQSLPAPEKLRIDLSDNYFDISAGSEHSVIISSAEKIKLNDLHIGHWWTEWE